MGIFSSVRNLLKQGGVGPDEAQAFVGEFDEQVSLLVLAVPTANEVDALQCCYHFNDFILVHHHEHKGHIRLVHWAVNPLV